MRVVAQLTRLANIVHNDDTKFPWNYARVMDTAYCTWAGGSSDGIVIVQSSWYWVHVNVTTLGDDPTYGGPDNTDYFVLVSRNGITLADTLVGASHGRPGGQGASLMHTGSPVYLTAGDELFVYTQNAGGTALLLESNPTDGPDYTTDSGQGVIGPHLFLVKLSGNAPV